MKENKTLHNSIAFYQKLIAHCQEGISLINEDDIIIYSNDSSKRINGYATIDDTNNHITKLVHPDDYAIVTDALEEVRQVANAQKTTHFRIKHALGHYIWLKCTFTNMLNDVDVNAIVCNCIDITEAKEAEELLQRKMEDDFNTLKNAEIRAKKVLEERNTILESIADAFFAVDKNWVVTYWNNSAAKVLLKPKEEVLHHNLWDVFATNVSSLSYTKYHEALATNQSVHFEDQYTQLRKWYEISAYPSDAGLSVYFKDITERKISELLLNNLNVSLHQQAKELSDSNAELEQFAYVASHDLQEPLRMITSFLTQLELKYNDVIDDRGKKYIYFAVDGAKRMRQIILDLLEYSRIGRLKAQVEEVSIAEIIEDVLVLYRKKIEEHDAVITFKGMPTINSYKVPIRQLFQNLISNALKYKDPSRAVKIAISCKETAHHYQFCIKDNGIGISKEYYDKIFIIFQRLHNKDEYSGTGMGLAIAKKIVENLGGKIWLESTLGIGTSFYFTIEKNKP
ncbi:sensor histidine kinase [Pedobacter boryungensis]|uniref:histidine kinase n=1 Tax=Pedobacter boryungensis TaxID=869962 RepID=A0ABX2DDL1_9SPHI|nr:PAS domain-containing sensor histidine kinase [Pedobacter boryungensis]NQX31061.1 PAS domain S-box protein [Pedobacter boryungensis]